MPTSPLSIIDQLQIRQEPRALLGRYFLAAEAELAALGLTLKIMPVKELTRVHAQFAESWNGLTPVLNTNYTAIPDDTAACLVAYDQHGVPAASHACRYIDLGERSAKEAFEELTCFFGAEAERFRASHVWNIDSPSAARIKGPIIYTGAFWVRRDHRGSRVGQIIQDVSRFYAASQWSFDHEVSIGSKAFRNPEIQQRYHFMVHEPEVTVYIDGKVAIQDAVFMYTPIQNHLDRLEGLIADAARELESLVVDRDQQRIGA
jgi:hypothetical protein